ncbi:cilia- and flagella-associated protein HOATZ-like [Amphiura filiformis]|uniref:cilia- and flagella-associated protein HOATZ-like n=1 Tax=Amphiura filiformis TaxID=82378 RepID=UPI003B21F853
MDSFSGCSEEDQACAKLFWQSLTLHPPIESRLVSGDIRQRLPVAPPGVQTANYAYKPTEESPKLTAHLAEAHAQTIYEESVRLTKQAIARQENLHILQKRKQERAKKDDIVRRATIQPQITDDDGDYTQDDVDEAAEALAELDKFDERLENLAK